MGAPPRPPPGGRLRGGRPLTGGPAARAGALANARARAEEPAAGPASARGEMLDKILEERPGIGCVTLFGSVQNGKVSSPPPPPYYL